MHTAFRNTKIKDINFGKYCNTAIQNIFTRLELQVVGEILDFGESNLYRQRGFGRKKLLAVNNALKDIKNHLVNDSAFTVEGFPAITLDNGLTVVNYSSPHTYKFDTGEVLPACDVELTKEHSLIERHTETKNSGGWIDVRIKDKLRKVQRNSLNALVKNPKVSVVLVPFRVKKAWENRDFSLIEFGDKIKVCRIEDRIKKLVSSTKFCT